MRDGEKSRAVSHGRAVSRSARRPYLRHARVGAAERQLTRVRLDWAVAGARPGGGERVGAERRVADREQYVRGGDDGRRSAVGGRRSATSRCGGGGGRRRYRRRRRARPTAGSTAAAASTTAAAAAAVAIAVAGSPSPSRRRPSPSPSPSTRGASARAAAAGSTPSAASGSARSASPSPSTARSTVRRIGAAARTRPPTRAGSSRRQPFGGALRGGIDGRIHVDRSHVVPVRAAVVRGAQPIMPSENMGGVAVDGGSRQHRTRARIIVRAPRTAARRLRAARAPATPIPRPLLVSWVGLKARWGAPKARLKARPKAPTGACAVPTSQGGARRRARLEAPLARLLRLTTTWSRTIIRPAATTTG